MSGQVASSPLLFMIKLSDQWRKYVPFSVKGNLKDQSGIESARLRIIVRIAPRPFPSDQDNGICRKSTRDSYPCSGAEEVRDEPVSDGANEIEMEYDAKYIPSQTSN